jgi:hypothetical protein
MSWKELLAENKVRKQRASKTELDAIRALIARDLEDAAIDELSDDRRFATAYNAALQTAKMSIACAGFRLASAAGHHRLTFEAALLALGTPAARSLDFFEACRRKRKVIDYDQASVATHTEAEEMLPKRMNSLNSSSVGLPETIRDLFRKNPRSVRPADLHRGWVRRSSLRFSSLGHIGVELRGLLAWHRQRIPTPGGACGEMFRQKDDLPHVV